ncbi:hypothetical protein [Actinokineospora xionganensis]|uniref:Lipoprotein LpqS n=1 Tax=Actinokineospora xionganensis TaxID=2684470 RepID=A0ABR7KZS1_9PSEU|nr:hypothetical protein [Actinokineospora xionganensis]MBC6445930.1 hypothetical protein [Actinokineospora xionganensis]
MRVALVLVMIFGFAIATHCANDGHGDGVAIAAAADVSAIGQSAPEPDPLTTHSGDHGPAGLVALCLSVTLAVLVWAAGLRPGSVVGVLRPPGAAPVSDEPAVVTPRPLDRLCVLRV